MQGICKIRSYMIKKEEIPVIEHFLAGKGSAITEKDLRVKLINDGESLGYTSGQKPTTVYVAYDHPYYKGLSDDKIKMMILGIFFHECLHQVFTDFDTLYEKLSEEPSESQQSVLMDYFNTLEDQFIEHDADEVSGGDALESLRFSIREIYERSPGIEESGSAFAQLINALINLGDVGFVKGEFTYDEAYRAFVKVAPLYCKGIYERSGRKRVDIAKQCMEITRPLWEKELRENEEMRKELKELLKQLMSAMGETSDRANPDDEGEGDESESGEGSEDSIPDDDSLSPEEKATRERREETLKKIAKAAEELKKEEKAENKKSSDSSSSDENSSDDKGTDDADGSGSETSDPSGSASGSSDTGSSDSPSGTSSDSGSSADNDEKASSEGNETSSDDTDNITGSGDPAGSPSDTSDSESKDGSDKSEKRPSFDLSDEEREEYRKSLAEARKKAEESAKKISKSIKDEEKSMAEAERRDEEKTGLPDVEGSCRGGKVICKNVKAGDRLNDECAGNDSPMEYRDIVTRNRTKISRLTRGLKDIFEAEEEDLIRGTSGRYNIIRGMMCTSPRIFDKRKDPGDKKDVAIVVAIDCSGSMWSEGRSQAAKEAACIVGEALMKCDIPHSMFGYTADTNGADAYHIHFVTWDNWKDKKSHEKLTEISPMSNNLDDYSIKYGGELLKRAPQSNKILIVISDGEPAASGYKSMSDGIEKTSFQIRQVKKFANVCGIAIGHSVDAKTLKKMYGANFIHIANIDELSNALIKRLIKTIDNSR